MYLFEMPAGQEAVVVTNRVGIVEPHRGLMVDRRLRITCTATNDYDTIGGRVRRRFSNCEPPIGPDGDVWLADAPVAKTVVQRWP